MLFPFPESWEEELSGVLRNILYGDFEREFEILAGVTKPVNANRARGLYFKTSIGVRSGYFLVEDLKEASASSETKNEPARRSSDSK